MHRRTGGIWMSNNLQALRRAALWGAIISALVSLLGGVLFAACLSNAFNGSCRGVVGAIDSLELSDAAKNFLIMGTCPAFALLAVMLVFVYVFLGVYANRGALPVDPQGAGDAAANVGHQRRQAWRMPLAYFVAGGMVSSIAHSVLILFCLPLTEDMRDGGMVWLLSWALPATAMFAFKDGGILGIIAWVLLDVSPDLLGKMTLRKYLLVMVGAAILMNSRDMMAIARAMCAMDVDQVLPGLFPLLLAIVVGGFLYWARRRCLRDWFNRLGPVVKQTSDPVLPGGQE